MLRQVGKDKLLKQQRKVAGGESRRGTRGRKEKQHEIIIKDGAAANLLQEQLQYANQEQVLQCSLKQGARFKMGETLEGGS